MILLDELVSLDATENPENDCKGLIFRCSDSQYFKENGKNVVDFGQRTIMRLLRKKSCTGCNRCQYLLDDLKEFTGQTPIDIRPNVEHKAEYMLEIVDIGTDPETGIVDEWNVTFIKLEN